MTLLTWVVSNVLVALGLALTAWFVQGRFGRPALAHVIWVLALAKLVTPAIVTVSVGRPPGLLACALGICGCDHHSPVLTFVRDISPWILLAVWSAGAGTKVWFAWSRWTQFRRLTAYATPAAAEWQARAAQRAVELSIRCPPRILVVPGHLPPMVVPGWPRCRLLLPSELAGGLNDAQKDALLVHELAHIKRGDHLVRVLEFAVGAAYWWLPIVGWIGRQLRFCEESCCDAAVVGRLPLARRDYARLLLDVIDFAGASDGDGAVPATAMSGAAGLELRLRGILDAVPGPRQVRPGGTFAVALIFALVPLQVQLDVAAQTTAVTTRVGPESGAPPSAMGCDVRPVKIECCPS